MTHLLAISVGPVQEFIAAARRTRDLWFGSYLLSEISRAAAQALEAEPHKGKLIFPATSDAGNVANVILAELPGGYSKATVDSAKEAAKRRWKDFADETWQQASGVIRSEIWNDQIDDVIEFYAAWVARTTDYRADRIKAMRLLAGRKNCRDFLPAKGRAGVPKSSLDGQRESVLKPPSDWPQKFHARLRIREGEQLDVVGMVKRVAGGGQPYPSVARIAADPWVRGNQYRLESVYRACEALGDQVIRRLDASYQQYTPFPYEGTAVYPNRFHELTQETEIDDIDLNPLSDALRQLPEPNPYLAILLADGDRMGAAITKLDLSDKHREFSAALAGFADEAMKIITKHNGVLVYAGGDDVLALLPVDTCLSCARKLREDFQTRLKRHGKLTLSVGIAIGHFMENLEDLLEYGRAAEKAAKKPDRDGLAVHLHKRGGAPIRVRAKWSDDPDERITQFARLMNDGVIPTRLPYELREMANLYEKWTDNAEAAIQQDLVRLIAKRGSHGEGAVRQALSDYTTEMDSTKLLIFAEQLLVARMIAAVVKQAGGEE